MSAGKLYIIVNRINHCTILKDEIRKLGVDKVYSSFQRECYNGHGGDIMAEKSVTVQNKDTLEEVLKGEKDPEVKRKLSFISMVAAGREVKEAVTHNNFLAFCVWV